MTIIATLTPVFLLVALGAVLRRVRFLPPDFFDGCAKLTYWIGLPSLLLVQIAASKYDATQSGRVFGVMLAASVAVVFVGAVTARLLHLEPTRRRTFIHTSFHCNTAFVGLPVVMYALAGAPNARDMLDVASMALAPMVPAINILSILVLRHGAAPGAGGLTWRVTKSIVTNPLVIACMAGIACAVLQVQLPTAAARGLDSLGRMALPLALLSIGAGLHVENIRGYLGAALVAALFNVALLPLIGWGLCRLLELSKTETLVALIFLACPTASSAYVYARQLAGDSEFAGRVIVLSTILSAGSLWAVLYWFM